MNFWCPKEVLIAILLTILTAGIGMSQTSPELATSLESVDAMLFQKESRKALETMRELPEVAAAPGWPAWKLAGIWYETGRQADSEEDAMWCFSKAEKYALAAIAEEPEKAEGYKWLAISLGAQSKYVGTKTQIRQSSQIKENIEKAIALNPCDDISFLVLSRWHYKISDLGFWARSFAKLIYGGLPEASLEESEALLLKAISIRDRIAHRYNLAKVYNRMGRREEALAQLQLALLLPVTFPEEIDELEKSKLKQQEW